MTIVWKGGRGGRAPYRTTHVRIPEPIKAAVMEMADDYRRGALIDSPAEDRPSDKKIQLAIDVLKSAADMDGRKTKKIQEAFKEVLNILEGE